MTGTRVKEISGRKWLVIAGLLAVAAVEITVGVRLYAGWSGIEGREQELDRRETALQTAEVQLQELQTAVEQERKTVEELQLQAESELEELERARQSLQGAQAELEQKMQEIVEVRKNLPSAHSSLYPEMYAIPAALESRQPANTVYLTFDDGPSARTAEILDILKEQDIKATFFVTGQTSAEAKALMRRIVEEGHTIAVHTYSHNYEQIYASVNAFLSDFSKIYELIHEATGVYPQIYRFPGGSVNNYNKGIYRAIIDEMERRGFVCYDWNALNGDAEGKDYTVEEMTQRALLQVGTSHVIMLMHDSASRQKTVACLPGVIEGYRAAGYSFDRLTPEVKSITFA